MARGGPRIDLTTVLMLGGLGWLLLSEQGQGRLADFVAFVRQQTGAAPEPATAPATLWTGEPNREIRTPEGWQQERERLQRPGYGAVAR